MVVLFCHNGPLGTVDGLKYYGVAHNDSTFMRYYSIADELHVAIRVKTISQEEANRRSLITVNPVKIIPCPKTESVKGIFKIPKLKKILKQAVSNADYVVARIPSSIGYFAAQIAMELNKPLLVEAVACPWDACWNHSLKGKFIAPINVYKMKKILRKTAYSLYVTNEFLQRRYPTNGKTISCSNVSLAPIDETVLENRLKRIKNKTDERIKIGTVAAVDVQYKGQQYVIRALGKLKKQGITNFEYHLVGGGDQSYLRSQAKKYDVEDQVKFIGPLPHDKVFEWLDTIDIYAQPSRQEGLPRALIEAMSRGLPCMGAKTGGIPELLEPSFIFSNSRKEIDEILEILLSMMPEVMETQARRNFETAKNYEKSKLEQRRREFFEEFKNSVVPAEKK